MDVGRFDFFPSNRPQDMFAMIQRGMYHSCRRECKGQRKRHDESYAEKYGRICVIGRFVELSR